jgi:hypothetical protein
MQRVKIILAGLLVSIASCVVAQEPLRPLEDNSFLLEEAFNQEAHVIQHIFTAIFNQQPSRALTINFTQEWPVGSQLHQFSLSVPATLMREGGTSGLNDVLLNYRFQLVAVENETFIAPRVSVILPTSVERMNGEKGVGLQLAFPYSHYVSPGWIIHVNGGLSLIPRRSEPALFGSKLISTMLGGSGIWLASPRFNILCELVFTSETAEDNNGVVEQTQDLTISPGFRFGIDVGALQIVPGLAFPIIVGAHETRSGILLYLSFEHPF